jgi:hypothetical protein
MPTTLSDHWPGVDSTDASDESPGNPYRWLKEWKAPTFHGKEREPRDREKRSFNRQAIKAAVSRYGELEDLLDAATAWIADDTDETWAAFTDLVDTLNGRQEG